MDDQTSTQECIRSSALIYRTFRKHTQNIFLTKKLYNYFFRAVIIFTLNNNCRNCKNCKNCKKCYFSGERKSQYKLRIIFDGSKYPYVSKFPEYKQYNNNINNNNNNK